MKKMMAAALAAFCLSSYAQTISDDFNVSISQPYEVVDARDKLYIPNGDGTVTSIKSSEEEITLQRFDAKSMEEKGRNVYEDVPRYHKVQRVITTNSGIYYLYEAYNKKEKTFSFYTRQINPESAEFLTNEKAFTTSRPVVGQLVDEHGSAPMVLKFNWSWVNQGAKFDVTQSFDKSKVLVHYRLKPETKNDSKNYDIIGFQVFDDKMRLLSSNEVKMPHTEAEMNNLAYAVDADGNAYMLIQLVEEKKFELLVIDEDGSLTALNLGIDGDKIFERFEITEDSEGHVRCAGIYARGYDIKVSWKGTAMASFNADGIYTFGITPEGQIDHIVDIEFPHEVIEQYMDDKEREKLAKREAEGKAGVEDLKLIEYITQEDGSSVVVCEQQYMRAESVTSKSMTYRYTNLIITKIDDQGEVVWMKKLPKNQYGLPNNRDGIFFKGLMGTKYIKGDGYHVMLFVDNPENENLPITERSDGYKNGTDGYLTAFKVMDDDGSVERHTLVDLTDINGRKAYQFNVNRICKVEHGHYVMEAYLKGKEDGMVSIELD